ncbi:hypothetical protein HOY80DRAFT_1134926 [Tuber brumale]|nr:hypothetical protein HOY80DRAFT_1134926 [Tuber brumale]
MPGYVRNDTFASPPRCESQGGHNNTLGGIQGGVSNSANVYFKVAFKVPATSGIGKPPSKYERTSGALAAGGRHELCVVPRAVAIVEVSRSDLIYILEHVPLTALQQRVTSRYILSPMPEPITRKAPAVVDGNGLAQLMIESRGDQVGV